MQEPELKFYSGLRRMQLCSNVRVIRHHVREKKLILRHCDVKAVWDTGAVTSAVSRKVADQLGMKVSGQATLSTGAGNIDVVKGMVILDLQIDDNVIPLMVAVVDNIPGDNNDFLVGMDVIQCGDLSVHTDHDSSQFEVSFKPYPGLFIPMGELFKI